MNVCKKPAERLAHRHGGGPWLVAAGNKLALWYAVPMFRGLLTRIGAVLMVALIGPGLQAQETRWSLDAEAWARPRDGRSVAQMAPLPEVIAAWSHEPGQRLLLRYPGGEEGALWVHELRAWLVALGVPLEAQELEAGSPQTDRIEIELTR